MVIERALQGHTVNPILLRNKAQQFGESQLKAVSFFQRHAEETFKVSVADLCAVCGPKEVIHHALAQGKAEGEGGGKQSPVNAAAVFLGGKGVDLELVPQKGGGGTAEAEEIIPGHGGIPGGLFLGEGPDGIAGTAVFQAVGGDGVQQAAFFIFWHGRNWAGSESEVDERIDSDVVGPAGKGCVDVQLQILKGLPGQSEDEVHGDSLKGDSAEGRCQSGAVHRTAPQHGLEFFLEGLYADTDAGDARILQGLQEGGGHIVRVELHADALGDAKVLLYGLDDFRQTACGEGGGPAAKIQAGDGLFGVSLCSCQVDLPDERVDIVVTGFPGIHRFAIGAEAANVLAEGDVDIQPQAWAGFKGEALVIFVCKDKGSGRTGQPHPCQAGYHTHKSPIYISDRSAAFPG